MEESISIEKQQLRAEIRAKLRAFARNQDECRVQSERLCARVCRSQVFLRAELVLAFIPLPTEASPLPLIEQALLGGKAVAVPRVQGGAGRMDFFFLNPCLPLDEQLQSGSYGIREPKPDLPLFVPEHAAARQKNAAVVILPGLLFGRDGSRLGQGGGYYDRYLCRLRNSGFPLNCVPFGYDFQFVESVPAEVHDVRFCLDESL